jgi:CubicO group peptidase (beta-lactamase class C family)
MTESIENFEPKIQTIDKILLKEFEKRKIPGCSIGIFQNQTLIYYRGFGVANLDKNSPVTKNTIFRLASVTKIFTTLGIMQLLEQGKIRSLDDPVNDYIKKGKVIPKESNWPEITFRHLLTHTSGIGELPKISYVFRRPLKGFGMAVKGKDVKVPRLGELHNEDVKVTIEPGKKYAYCNFGFSLLGYLTEVISGIQWEEYIRKNIFEPLEMEHSEMWRSDRVKNHEAQGYIIRGGKPKPVEYWQNIISPAGSLYSCVEDMAKFAKMIYQDGKYDKGYIITPKSFELMKTPEFFTHEIFREIDSVGLCFHLGTIQNKRIIEHSGATWGFTSAFTLIPEEKLAICVFSNVDEIFSSQGTAFLKNLILQNLLEETEEQDIEEVPTSIDKLIRFKGYYGPVPGILTNTRYYQTGGDLKIEIRNGALWFSRFYGPSRKGKRLFPTEDPLIFKYKTRAGGALNTINQVAFNEGKNGEILELNVAKFRFRKNSFGNSFRFWCYWMCSMLVTMIVIISIIATL